MHYLPAIAVAEGVWRLPLVEPTAARLLACLGATHDPQRFSLLADTLAGDPALALWTALRAGDAVGSAEPDAAALAAWLGPRLARDLAATVNAPACPDVYTAATAERTADSVYHCLIVARVARELAPRLLRESAYLLGLLSEAVLWGKVALGEHVDVLPLLPLWLRRALEALAAPGGGAAVVEAVRGAELQLQVATERSLQTQAAMICERQHAERVRSDWLAGLRNAPAPCARSLPFVAAQLDSADALRLHFAARVHEEKLDALRELAYGATHEINNPLANISTRAEVLLAEERHPERRRMLETIRTQALRAHEMIADLMHFARPHRPSCALTPLAPLVAEVAHAWRAEAQARRIALVVAPLPPELKVWADRTQFAVALGALVRNALEAIGQEGGVSVHVQADDAWAHVEVRDNGPGFPAEAAPHLFEPFYSGREAGRGLGFGLTNAWRIMEGMGGRVTGENLPGGGARFTLQLSVKPPRAEL